MNVFVFDIETVPDVENSKHLYNLEGLNDHDVVDALQRMRRQETGHSDFMRLHLQRIVAISVVLRNHDQLKIWSLGEINSSEKELIERFYNGIEKFTPNLVSWNGSGFDLPVLHYRSLLHGVRAPKYWEVGECDSSFRWNSYLNRYHYRHLDLMDVLAGYQPRANAPLDEIAQLLGLPGKMGMSGSEVWKYFQKGELESIRNYCETDVLNTYLIYLRFEMLRGKITPQQYQDEILRTRQFLTNETKAHWQEFLAHWKLPNDNAS